MEVDHSHSCDAVHHALPSPEHMSVSERANDCESYEKPTNVIWSQAEKSSNGIAPVLGGWAFQAQWTA